MCVCGYAQCIMVQAKSLSSSTTSTGGWQNKYKICWPHNDYIHSLVYILYMHMWIYQKIIDAKIREWEWKWECKWRRHRKSDRMLHVNGLVGGVHLMI